MIYIYIYIERKKKSTILMSLCVIYHLKSLRLCSSKRLVYARTRPHGVTTQRTTVCSSTTVKTSILYLSVLSSCVCNCCSLKKQKHCVCLKEISVHLFLLHTCVVRSVRNESTFYFVFVHSITEGCAVISPSESYDKKISFQTELLSRRVQQKLPQSSYVQNNRQFQQYQPHSLAPGVYHNILLKYRKKRK